MSNDNHRTIVPIYGIYEPFSIIKQITNQDELELKLSEKDITLKGVDLSSEHTPAELEILRAQLGLIDVRIQRIANDIKDIRVACPTRYRDEVDKLFKEGYTDKLLDRDVILFVFNG